LPQKGTNRRGLKELAEMFMSLYMARQTLSLARRTPSLARKISKNIFAFFVGALISVSIFMSSLCKGVTGVVSVVTSAKFYDIFLLAAFSPTWRATGPSKNNYASPSRTGHGVGCPTADERQSGVYSPRSTSSRYSIACLHHV